MPETKRMAGEATRIVQEAQEQAKTVARNIRVLSRVALKRQAALSLTSTAASRPLPPR